MRLTYLRRRLTLRERGDTIVEVLIAIAVVSMVLGGAYVTTNRSLLSARDAQERAIALKLTESQIEQLKGIVTDNPNAIFGPGAPTKFCATSPTSIADSANAACTVDSSGSATAVEPAFHLSITRSGNSFTVVNQWANVRGHVTNNIQMKYRTYQ